MSYDCLQCGACCRAFGIIEVEPEFPFEHLVVPTELGYLRMKTEGFKCICLLPDNRCGIYSHRPRVCRLFRVGRELCLMARAHEGIREEEEHESRN